MSTLSELLLSRIDQRLEALGGKPNGRTRYWLAKTATDGRALGAVTDIARKGHVPKEERLSRFAAALETSVDYLLGRADNPAPVLSEVELDLRRLPRANNQSGELGIPLVGTGDCADLTVITDDGSRVEVERSSFDPEYYVRYVQRPEALRGNKDAYAIYYHGASMEPRFFAGEVGIVDPRRHAGPGDFVLVQLNDGTTADVSSVLVKRLVRLSTKEVTLEQYNPRLIFSIPRQQVVRLHRIVPPTEHLLFGST